MTAQAGGCTLQREALATAVECLETEVNWCAAIRGEVALHEQRPPRACESKLQNCKQWRVV